MKKYHGYKLSVYKNTNSRIRTEWIDEGFCLVIVNGPIGRRPMMVRQGDCSFDEAANKYKMMVDERNPLVDDDEKEWI